VSFAPPRGTGDLLPPRSDAMLGLYEAAHRTAELFGYRYVETPGFEPTDLFSRTSGGTSDVVLKEMFTFEDQGGRSITLRPEGTAPVVRAYLAHAHDLGAPFRAYYVNSAYRHGRPQAGRLREFRVFGIEVIGVGDPPADVEAIVLGDRFLRERGLRALRLLVNSIGDEVCRPAYREELLEYLRANRGRLRDEHRDRFEANPLRVLDCKDEACRAVAAGAPKISDRLCEPCAEHFRAVRAGLEAAGIAFEHDPLLVRGLDYYTRTAFEFVSDSLAAAQSTLCGGGRYDGLAEILGGPRTPGVGFGLGLDRVLLAIEAEGIDPPPPRLPRCFVVTFGEGAAPAGERLAAELRDAGISATVPLEERPLKAQLKMADRAGAAFAAIVGPDELERGSVRLRRMDDGDEEDVARADVVNWLLRHTE
jgi:histidyl-tRNA synthetase